MDAETTLCVCSDVSRERISGKTTYTIIHFFKKSLQGPVHTLCLFAINIVSYQKAFVYLTKHTWTKVLLNAKYTAFFNSSNLSFHLKFELLCSHHSSGRRDKTWKVTNEQQLILKCKTSSLWQFLIEFTTFVITARDLNKNSL